MTTGETYAGHVTLAGAGPGDPELLTLKTLRVLGRADVVLHDRLVSREVLALARPGALLVETGKEGYGTSMPQAEINAAMIAHAQAGRDVLRLKSGDAAVFGRLGEELDALDAAGIPHTVLPGITAASAAAATLGQSLTQRGRNGEVRLLTGHDVKGFAEADWRALARPGAVAAIYMGRRAARFVQGRMLMHGADPLCPVSIVENASRPDARVIEAHIGNLPQALELVTGPAVLMLGLSPRCTVQTDRELREAVR